MSLRSKLVIEYKFPASEKQPVRIRAVRTSSWQTIRKPKDWARLQERALGQVGIEIRKKLRG